MAFDVNQLIADARAARAQAEQAAIAAKQAADAKKATSKAINDVKLQVDSKYNYANTLKSTLDDIEGQLGVWATKIARDGKLSPVDQQEFDRLVNQYKSVDKSYSAASKEVNTILAKMPKGAEAEAAKDSFNKVPLNGTITGDGAPKPEPRDYAKEQSTAAATLITLKDSKRLELAKKLKEAGYNVPLTGVFNDRLVGAYQEAVGANAIRNQTLAQAKMPELNFDQFLAQKSTETAATGGTGGAGGISNYIYSPTEAKATINKIVTSLLGRDATDKEVASISKQLIAAQKANPGRTVNGVTTGRLDADQFVTDIIKGSKEFASKVQAKQDLTAQTIENTLKANGVPYKPDQVKAYADRVKNGEDINTIENEIRSIASFGQPDSVKKLLASGTDLETLYAPYKRIMASSLDLNPDTITLDDPTLRMAIGPDKEMSLYDYKKAIRQDSRWKYSQEANDEVTNMINQVKRDFGFMG